MSAYKAKNDDYKPLTPSAKGNGADGKDISSLKPAEIIKQEKSEVQSKEFSHSLTNHFQTVEKKEVLPPLESDFKDLSELKPVLNQLTETGSKIPEIEESATSLTFAEEQKQRKKQRKSEKDEKLLDSDTWLSRNGHTLTYIGIFLFSVVLYFRPYEWIDTFKGFTSIALILAVITLLIYIPTQLAVEDSLTILTTEVKCILFLAFWALLTMPIAKDPGIAWKTYSDVFIKIVLIFIVMVNTLRTKERLKGVMWLSIGVGVMLSYQAIDNYRNGKFEVEGYRVDVDFGGMFGNPNDAALHLVMFIPLVVILGIISKNKISKLIYFICAGMMVAGDMVTQSRGGFLGLLAVSVVLVWKLSKKNRLPIILIAIVIGAIIITFAPGNYWMRILSILIPSLDPVGSADQRRELLQLSIQVTLRNPWGIGIGNFPIVGIRNLQTHNAFTQISSELGWLSLAAYLIFMISPLRKLAAIERQMFAKKDFSWIYYLSIGIQTTIIGYMVSSFFVSVAYQWFVYYPIAYAVCLRRIYKNQEDKREPEAKESSLNDYSAVQKL